MADTPVLTFGDTTLYERDIQLLRPESWVNDNIIGFFLCYITDDIRKRSEHAHLKNTVVQLHPSVMMMIKTFDSTDLQVILADLKMDTADIVLVPINNNKSRSSGGGTHWSLLVWEKTPEKFYHLDSLNNSNEYVARALLSKIAPLLKSSAKASITKVTPPQQSNFFRLWCFPYGLC